MNYQEHLDVLKSHDSKLGGVIEHWRNLKDILKRHTEADGSLTECDLVQQDEYSYDFLLPLRSGCWLSFAVS